MLPNGVCMKAQTIKYTCPAYLNTRLKLNFVESLENLAKKY